MTEKQEAKRGMYVEMESRREEIDSLIEAGAMIAISKRWLGSYREQAGITTWDALALRSGVHVWHFTKPLEEPLAGNFTVETWLRIALAVGRHPFAIAQVIGPVAEFDITPYGKIYRGPDAKVWGWEREEIDRAIESEQARILLDRPNLRKVWDGTWRSLSRCSGAAYHTIQKLPYPKNNPTAETTMRLALACRVHPFALLRVGLPSLSV